MNTRHTEKLPSYNETTKVGQPDESEISVTYDLGINESAQSALIPHPVAAGNSAGNSSGSSVHSKKTQFITSK